MRASASVPCPVSTYSLQRTFWWRCARGTHPFPSRTRWLRPGRPMVLCWRRHGRAGGCQIHGGIAQLGEHLPCKQGVKGSNPFISTVTEKKALCGRICLSQRSESLLSRRCEGQRRKGRLKNVRDDAGSACESRESSFREDIHQVFPEGPAWNSLCHTLHLENRILNESRYQVCKNEIGKRHPRPERRRRAETPERSK